MQLRHSLMAPLWHISSKKQNTYRRVLVLWWNKSWKSWNKKLNNQFTYAALNFPCLCLVTMPIHFIFYQNRLQMISQILHHSVTIILNLFSCSPLWLKNSTFPSTKCNNESKAEAGWENVSSVGYFLLWQDVFIVSK